MPLIIQWQGKISENIVIDEPVTSMDLFPTIMDFTSVEYKTDKQLDGIRFCKLLTENEKLAERSLYWNYPHYHKGSGMKPACAIRSGDYKLIKWYEPFLLNTEGTFELFNLKDDTGEDNNLAHEFPEIVQKLDNDLENWKLQVGAQEPTITKK